MGLDRATIDFLISARDRGVSLDRVLTIGRQGLCVSGKQLRRCLASHGIDLDAAGAERLLSARQGFCEPLLELLGAGAVDSLDVSPYEGATILHDMNQPLPSAHHDRYSLVLDGGSLEHVFHFPTALANCMRATAPSGHFITVTPANNQMGHGLYQFSPELFFRVLTPANGFLVVEILLYEDPKTRYRVADPEQVRSRVELINWRPTQMIVWAKKTASGLVFAETPQQSDYSAIWRETAGKTITAKDMLAPPPASFWRRHAPGWISRLYRLARPYRKRLYTRVR